MAHKAATLMSAAALAIGVPLFSAASDDPFAPPERAWQQDAIYKNTIPTGWETLVLADTEAEREIARKVIEIYRLFESGPTDENLSPLIAERYIQHSVFIPNGRAPLAELFGQSAEEYPVVIDIHRIIVQDNYAFAHVNFRNLDNENPNDLGMAAVDIYRFNDAGLLEEHWDVVQNVPAFSPNPNGMFLLAE